MASLVLERKVLNMSKMLMNAQNISRRILKNSGEKLGVWRTEREGGITKLYILWYLLNFSHIVLGVRTSKKNPSV